MSGSIIFAPEARVELIEAQDWYEGKVKGLGSTFRSEVVRSIERLAESPLHFPKVARDVRRARLHGFPYALYFRLMPHGIHVLACFHSRRDPKALRDRA